MTDKIGGKKKITGVSSATKTEAVEKAQAVAESTSVGAVKGVKATTGVGQVKGAGGVGRRGPTKIMTPQERQEFLRMVDEETEKMVKSGMIPPSKKAIVQGAVKITVQAGWTDDAEVEDSDKKKK